MTSVKAKLSEARDLIARLKVEQDPVRRIELSRAYRIAAEDLRDAITASAASAGQASLAATRLKAVDLANGSRHEGGANGRERAGRPAGVPDENS